MAGAGVTATRDIVSEPHEVWQFILDVERMGRMLTGVIGVRRTVGIGPIRIGDSWTETRLVQGRALDLEMTVIQLDEPRQAVFEARGSQETVIVTISLSPSSLGTRVQLSHSPKEPVGKSLMSRIGIGGGFGGKALREQLDQDLEDMSKAIEKNVDLYG